MTGSRVVLGAAWVLAGGVALAQTAAPLPHTPPAPLLAAPAPAAAGAVPGVFDLTEFVHRAIVGNAATQAAHLQALAAGRLVASERALYDPAVFGRLRREGVDRPRSDDEISSGLFTSAGGKTETLENNNNAAAGLRGRLPSGATFELSQDLRRRASNLLSDPAEREHRGTLTLTLKQPLLRGYGRSSTEADLRVAEKEQQIEQQRLVKQVLELVGEAAGTWWRLHQAERLLAVRRQGLQTAFELQAETRRRVEGGFAPRIDLLEAELAIASRQTELTRAQQALVEAQARARNLLGQEAPQEPGPVRAAPVAPVPWLDAATGSAAGWTPALLERWPAYQIAQRRLEQEQLRLDHARRQERPDVSLELGLNRNSLSDRAGSAWERSLGAAHQGWFAGVLLEMPLANDAARSRREAQMLRRDAARAQADGEARLMASEWVTRQGQVQASRSELEQLQRELAAREALLAAEKENHALGRSRLRQLIEAQDRVEDGRLRLADAELRARLSDLAFMTIAGSLLEDFGVRLALR